MTARPISAGGLSRAITSVAGGNVSGSYTPTVGVTTETWLTCTLTGDTTFNISLPADTIAKVFATQDATGSRNVIVSNGVVSVPVPVNPTAGIVSLFTVFSPDGTELVVEGGGAGFPPAVKTTDYTFVSTDAGHIIEVNSTSTRYVTIPSGAGFNVGDTVTVTRLGTGDVIFKAASGVIARPAYRKITSQYGVATLYMRAANDWVLSGGVSAATTFDPASITGQALWLEADTITGKNNGDSISQWNDTSGNSRNAANATGATQPEYAEGVVNGLPTVQFGATVNDLLTVAGITNNTAARTFIAVVRRSGTAGGRVWRFDGHTQLNDNSGPFQFQLNEAAGGVSLGGTTTAWNVITVKFTSTSSADGYVNSGTATNFNPDDAYQAGVQALTVGNAPGGGVAWAGDIAVLGVYNAALSDSDRTALVAHLTTKYGL